jgi:hypothetical protein
MNCVWGGVTGRNPAEQPLSAPSGGEGGARRGCAGRVRWVARLFGRGGSPTSSRPSPPPRAERGIFRPPVRSQRGGAAIVGALAFAASRRGPDPECSAVGRVAPTPRRC